ncbi:ornithine cyclodeaminase family protein [Acuticoccus sp. M5D2P5]|uniref:ornithine cyclodeaminase family protein n=1 Tax=Acuticoccus kalidii TaxID=2910977 RepID=UPI001F167ABE|nr:ornithine cyclodeaminase family protein [Acuticoccus kalidii]MCF3934926.1 ornithine cyclodeaminase family protein [Acuticoccus kalidii]
MMIVVDETEARSRVSLSDAVEAVEAALRDLAAGTARLFPAVRERVAEGRGTFGVKSAELPSAGIVGLKAGGYWPGNARHADKPDNHQSTTLVFERETGRVIGAVAANWLTEARTAAVGAIAIRALAREDATTLAIIGTGKQAASQVEAALLARPFTRVLLAGRSPEGVEALRDRLAARGIEAAPATVEAAVRAADVVITITPAAEPLFPAEWVRPGTHINAMGSDTRGKREMDGELVTAARLVVDDIEQSATLGEIEAVPQARAGAVTLGDVLAGTVPGRTDAAERTLFDSTGLALQDLCVAARALGIAAR